VLEEIVGEIEDEFDTSSHPSLVAEGESYRVNGLYPMHDLREKLGLMRLEMGDVDTLNGYIVQQLGRWPRVGDVVDLGNYRAQVVTVAQNGRERCCFTPVAADGPNGAEEK